MLGQAAVHHDPLYNITLTLSTHSIVAIPSQAQTSEIVLDLTANKSI